MQEIEWGEPTEGLRISVSVAKPRFQRREPVALTVALQNVSDVPIPIMVRSPWGEYTLRARRDETELPLSPYAVQRIEAAGVGRRTTVDLQPGEIRSESFELDRAFDLTVPGTYRVVAARETFRQENLDKFATVVSNELTFTVEP